MVGILLSGWRIFRFELLVSGSVGVLIKKTQSDLYQKQGKLCCTYSFVYEAINWWRFLISTQRSAFKEMQLETRYATQRKTSQKIPRVHWFDGFDQMRINISPLDCCVFCVVFLYHPVCGGVYTYIHCIQTKKHLINHGLPKYTVSLYTLEN